jgi:hypothetical protein
MDFQCKLDRNPFSQATGSPFPDQPQTLTCAHNGCTQTFTVSGVYRRKYCDEHSPNVFRAKSAKHKNGATKAAMPKKNVNPLVAGDIHGNVLKYPDCKSWVDAWNAGLRGPKPEVLDVCERYALPEHWA